VEILGPNAVCLTGAREVLAQAWPFGLPGAHADIDVVPLREHPAVPAGDIRQLDHRAPVVAVARDAPIGDVALESDAVDDPGTEAESARARAVRTVGTNNDVGAAEVSGRTLADLDPSLSRRVQEECIEPPSLSHGDHRSASPPLDRVAVPEPELHDVDELFYDGRRIDRAAQEGPRCQPTATGLVARKGRLVDE
jgi:hypothetical protein